MAHREVRLGYVADLAPLPQIKKVAADVLKSMSIDPKGKRLTVKAQFIDASQTKLTVSGGLVMPNNLYSWYGVDGMTRFGPFVGQLTYEHPAHGVPMRNLQVGYALNPQIRISYVQELLGGGPQINYNGSNNGVSGWVRAVVPNEKKPPGVMFWIEKKFGP